MRVAPEWRLEPVFIQEKKSPLFPSGRFFLAFILCLCFVALSVSTSNISQSMVCMIQKNTVTQQPEHQTTVDGEPAHLNRTTRSLKEEEKNATETPCERKKRESGDEVTVESCANANKLHWTSLQQGFIFAAQNFGSLFMLVTGTHADRLNGKWTICAALILLIVSNTIIPFVAQQSVWYVFVLRIITGMGDALLFPSASSMITRWFPPKERPFALGFVTGGRQLGTLLILPVAGAMCDSQSDFGGWKPIFWLSAIICAIILVIWVILSADKPSKHCFVTQREEAYITRKIEEERLGKRNERPSPPWKEILTSRALYVSVAALVCHEFPLVIMIQYLPKFFSDVLGLSGSISGLVAALPSVVLFVSKTMSSSLSSYLTAAKPPKLSKTSSCKIFNFLASLGLGICLGVTPILGQIESAAPAIVVLCLANAFAGLHTPGVQTALVQLAPAYSGIVTGISFATVAVFSIMNKLMISVILENGTTREWTIVFEISAVVALLPVVFFTLWGTADIQPWAMPNNRKKELDSDTESQNSNSSNETTITTLAKYSMYLTHDLSSKI